MPLQGTAIFESKQAEEFIINLKKRFGSIEAGSKELAGIISGTVFRDVMKHFDDERGPESSWQAWSDAYTEHMQKIGKGGNKILQDTGRLRQGFMPSNYRVGKGTVIFFNKAVVNGFPYAAAHDEGGPKLPQRKFMWLSDEAMDSIANQVLRWIADTGRE